MKNSVQHGLAAVIFLLTFSVGAYAGPGSEDFNTLIEENSTAQKKLAKDLQRQLRTQELKQKGRPNFHTLGEAVVGRGASESVAVTSSNSEPVRADKKRPNLEKKNFNRISQEFKDVK